MSGYQRFGYGVAALLLASSVFHGVVYVVDGGAWEGPVSWRKPILFGFSFGVTLLSLVWIAGRSRLRPRTGRLLVLTLAVASLAETALIDLQRWRGVPSHLNFATPFDTIVSACLAAVAILGLIPPIIVLAVLAWRRFDGSPSMRLAVRAGLASLLLTLVSGGLLIANGRAIGLPPEATDLSIFGAAGQLKVPHAVSLHGVQALPVLAWVLTMTGWSEAARVRLAGLAAAGYGGVVLVSMLQAAGGLAPADLTVVSGVLLLGAAGALTGASAATLVKVRIRSPKKGVEFSGEYR
ncbi:hypothetical protein [Nonomuraea typhae]|uniref:hypothetical protein n=1 Tax=Nonomuraea typhae TaxID=2603600 RepID=UPI0012FBF60F|nr:hypothetical protein [Nonomuraea typhae]